MRFPELASELNTTGLTNFEFTIGGKWVELLRFSGDGLHQTPGAGKASIFCGHGVDTDSSAYVAGWLAPA